MSPELLFHGPWVLSLFIPLSSTLRTPPYFPHSNSHSLQASKLGETQSTSISEKRCFNKLKEKRIKTLKSSEVSKLSVRLLGSKCLEPQHAFEMQCRKTMNFNSYFLHFLPTFFPSLLFLPFLFVKCI